MEAKRDANSVSEPADPADELRIRRRRRTCRFWLIESAVAAALGLVVAIIWIANTGLTSGEKWQIPEAYKGDGVSMLAWIKAAEEKDYHFIGTSFIRRLGAPFEANWSDYPMPEKPFNLYLGQLSRWGGTMFAANAGILTLYVLATVAFYLVCRKFRWCRWWSAVGAIVFGCQHYIGYRGQAHMFMALIYTLPAALSVVWLVFGSRRLGLGSSNRKWCFAVSLWMGISNPYFLNMYLQLLIISAVLHALRNGASPNFRTAGWCLMAAIGGFILSNNSFFLIRFLNGPNSSPITRNASDSEIYALRPIELFMPSPEHRWEPLAAIGRYYKSHSLYHQPESFSAYLGIVGVIALLALLVVTLQRLLANRADRVPLAFWFSAWVILYSMVGGLNYAFALAGITIFRATNRFSVFIVTMLLMWAVSALHQGRRRWPATLQVIVGLLAMAAAVWDQLPGQSRNDTREANRELLAEDADFGRMLEADLPKGAMVFQLPAVEFPEGGSVLQMELYEQLRPFLNTRDIRFSFGSNRGRPDAAWSLGLQRLPPRAMVKKLMEHGFHAIVVHREGYPERADRLLAILGGLGLQLKAVSDDHDFVLVQFPTTNPDPQLPILAEVDFISYGRNWMRKDISAGETLWTTKGEARFKLNPNISPGERLRLSVRFAAVEPIGIKGRIGDQELFLEPLGTNAAQAVSIEFSRPDNDVPLVISVFDESLDPTEQLKKDFGITHIDVERLK